MDDSVYKLFGLAPDASPYQISSKCKEKCSEWELTAVRRRLMETQCPEEAAVNAIKVFEEGLAYIKSAAAMLLDPAAKQCYDAWLDARRSPSPEKITLTRSRLLWFNQTSKQIRFDVSMIQELGDVPKQRTEAPKTTHVTLKPKCRICRSGFNLAEDYLVLHCHCTTRVGHVGCINDFSTRMKEKCPVCRQTLLKRHQVSKYLFWNVKEKYKFIS